MRDNPEWGELDPAGTARGILPFYPALLEDKKRLWPWQRSRDSSQRARRERASSSEETEGIWQNRELWERFRLEKSTGLSGNLPNLCNDGSRWAGNRVNGSVAPVLVSESASSFLESPAWPEIHWRLRATNTGGEGVPMLRPQTPIFLFND